MFTRILSILFCLILAFEGPVSVYAQSVLSTSPKVVMLDRSSPQNEFAYYAGANIPESHYAGEVLISDKSLEKISLEEYYRSLGYRDEISEDMKDFLIQDLIPKEAKYFEPDVGLHEKSGMPYDHIRYRLKKEILGEVGNYTAASKLSLSIPFLLKVIQGKAPYTHLEGWSPRRARKVLKNTLQTIKDFIDKYPEFKGFLPWVDIRPNATIAPANTKIPSLDNGQLTWAIVAAYAVFERENTKSAKEIRTLAREILEAQDYDHFLNSETGLLHGTIQISQKDGKWIGDQTYHLDDMFEGTLAVLWGILHGQVSEEVWNNLEIPMIDYELADGQKVTTFEGFRSSFHEFWALGYLPWMDSKLSVFLYNYLQVQADHAQKTNLPGFITTAYDPKGVYRQMGVPKIAGQRVDRDDVAVVFGTAMSMLISPAAGAKWLKFLYEQPGLLSKDMGAVESLGPDGVSDIFTADGKGMTLLAASGGVLDEIESYLKRRRFLNTKLSMYDKLMELFNSKFDQVVEERRKEGKPIYLANRPIASPPNNAIKAEFEKPVDAGDIFVINDYLQNGHLHGKNVTSMNLDTLENDLYPGSVFNFEYEIPEDNIYFDQWAFRGTYIEKAVRVADMNYLTVEIPRNSDPVIFEIEIKSDDVTLAFAVLDTVRPAQLSEDGLWKRYMFRIYPVTEAEYKPFNYLSIAIHDPSFLEDTRTYKRRGAITLNNITLWKDRPGSLGKKGYRPMPNSNNALTQRKKSQILKYWRMSHGDMQFTKDARRGVYHFEGGRGWRGGYVPYTDVGRFKYIYMKLRNTSVNCNCFYIEMKHEGQHLVGKKIPIKMADHNQWQVFELKIPDDIQKTFNYFAISDSFGGFEIGGVLMSENKISRIPAKPILYSKDGRAVKDCRFQCSRSA